VTTWHPEAPAPPVRISAAGWGLALVRGAALSVVTYGGLAVLLALRLVERPLAGQARPVTPFITQGVCRASISILGIGWRVRGRPMRGHGAIVANHTSWLDIFVLNACQRVYFVSKAEVAGWAGIGWLARATGTAFIARDPRQAKAQQALFEGRIRAGHRLLFFPEGTSTDGQRVLPFKPTLFAAFYTHGSDRVLQIQPVSVIYRAPKGRDPRFYGWWGDMSFLPHFLSALAEWRRGAVEVVFHDPVSVGDFPTRKDLAAYCEGKVRAGLEEGLGTGGGRA